MAILGVVLPIYDVLYDADIRHILTRHEQGLLMPLTECPCFRENRVCIATSGPGATNLVTGIATANRIRSPWCFSPGRWPRT